MLRKVSLCLVPLFIVVGVAGSASAQVGKWVFWGSAHVDGGVDMPRSRSITARPIVPSSFEVSGSTIQFDHVIIRYGNGEQDTIALPQPDSGRRRESGDRPSCGRRAIDRVELWYQKASWGRKPE